MRRRDEKGSPDNKDKERDKTMTNKWKKEMAVGLETAYRHNGKGKEFQKVASEIVAKGYHWKGVYSVCGASGGNVHEVCMVSDADHSALPTEKMSGVKFNYLSAVRVRMQAGVA